MKKTKSILTALVIIFSVSALFSQEDHKVKVTRVKGNIYKLYISDFVNIFAFIGSDGVLLVDSGFHGNAEEVISKLSQLGNGKIRYIINTHADWDHIAGNHALGKDAEVISHSNSRKQILEYIDWEGFPFDRTILKKSLPTMTFEKNLTLYFNGEKIKLIYMSGAHTDDDIIVYFETANIVCLGDMFLPGSFPVVKLDNGGSVKDLVKNIDIVLEMFPEDVILVFGHGENYTLNDLKKYRKMVVNTINKVSTAKNDGKMLEEIKKENILKDWASWSGTVFEDVTSDKWIETIYNSVSK
ncbi:MBL fold metallo-hydrolase [candidate division KSB1 bacterium]